MMTTVEQLTDRCTFHGEGPYWDAGRSRLLFVDMLAGDIVALDDSGLRRYHVGSIAAVVRARTRGGYIVALERGFALTDDDLDGLRPLPPVFDSTAIRMNEGGCGPDGRFYCGTMAYDGRPGAGTVYRLDADLASTTALEGTTISNGLQWSADGRTAYFSDTATSRVDMLDFDIASGAMQNRRPFIQINAGEGAPDGVAIDEEGGLWVALWGGGAVRHYDSAGTLRDVLELPVSNVTSCAFGGPSMDTLFITTSREGLGDDSEEPAAGAVFVAEAGVRGSAPHSFAG